MQPLNVPKILWVFGLITAALFVFVGFLVYALQPTPVEIPVSQPSPTEQSLVEEAQVVLTLLEPIDNFSTAHAKTGISGDDHATMVRAGKSTNIHGQILASLYFTESTNGTNTGSSDPYSVLAGPKMADQLQAFERICAKVGKDPKKTSVGSCGEMGPFQFMPLTWQDFGTDADGDGVKNPWSTSDAAFAAAKYLDHLGYRDDPVAAVLRYKGERKGKAPADSVTAKTLKFAAAMGAPLQLDY